MPRSLPEGAKYILQKMKALGINVSPGSRLERMHHVLIADDGCPRPTPPVGHPDFESAVEARRDITQLQFILDTAPDPPLDAMLSLLRKTAKDPVLPQYSGPESAGRDAQAELYVAAVCRAAGLHPVEHAEPDVRCTLDDQIFGLAVKRIKSQKRLLTRVSEAAKQIEACRLPGIIVLDTTLALNPKNRRLWRQRPDAEFALTYQVAMNEFVRRYHDRLQEAVRGRGARGIAFHDSQVRLRADGGWWLEGMTFWLCTARENQRRNREFEAFSRAYQRGLPNLVMRD